MTALENLAMQLGAVLKSRGFMLALAESCTGGMAAQVVTSVAGSSAWFERGFVTYSNQAKMDMLGVSPQTIESFGAVSEETATEMASGSINNSRAQIAGSVTGVAGPDGGTAAKPVGMVCFAIAQANGCYSFTQYFAGDREVIRNQATVYLMQQLIAQLT